jgi:hypothetical protein
MYCPSHWFSIDVEVSSREGRTHLDGGCLLFGAVLSKPHNKSFPFPRIVLHVEFGEGFSLDNYRRDRLVGIYLDMNALQSASLFQISS